MSISAIARKDFQDAVRSRAVLILAFVFVVFFASAAYFFSDFVVPQLQQGGQQQNQITSDQLIRALSTVTTILIPFIAIIVAYASIIGERESGTLKLLLSLPHSRFDVVAGKTLGRAAVVTLPVIGGFVAAMLVFPLTTVPLEAGNFILFAVLTAFLGLIFVALAVGVSAAAESNLRAVLGAVGLYVLFTLFWNSLVNGLLDQVTKVVTICPGPTSPLAPCPTMMKIQLALKHLNPTQAYKSLSVRIVSQNAAQARTTLISGPYRPQIYLEQLQGSIPVYLSDPAVVLYLLLWLVVPPVLGYYVFERADL